MHRWVKATDLELPQNHQVVDMAMHILRGCATLYRVRSFETQGLFSRQFFSDMSQLRSLTKMVDFLKTFPSEQFCYNEIATL